ncbi:hypothetical protein SPI_07214 [Niveomyces insectorum RCEF 264]|uniref:CHAT domain-containing protein n=1 Tax=Niveomyces insectorum RCEF 264 TaxID=1081102 RepID=A0A167QE16_9HYPO|nr:hypothetical protein SPI_07214 [Niveomyces insectorum RCEF 264]
MAPPSSQRPRTASRGYQQPRAASAQWLPFYARLACLDDDAAQNVLQSAVRLTFYGFYDEALALFAQPPLLQASSSDPFVAMAHSVLYSDMGLSNKRLDVLRACAVPAAAVRPRADKADGADVWDLLALFVCLAEYDALGTMRSAMEVAFDVMACLATKRHDAYDEIELQCALRCHYVLFFCRQWSNWLDHIDETRRAQLGALMPPEEISRSLQTRGHLADAARVLYFESTLREQSPGGALAPFQAFLKLVAAQPPEDAMGTCAVARIEIRLAELLLDAKKRSKARRRLARARRGLRHAAAAERGLPAAAAEQAFPTHWLLLSSALIRAQASSVAEELDSTLALSTKAFQRQDYVVYRNLVLAALELLDDLEKKKTDSQRPSMTAEAHARIHQRRMRLLIDRVTFEQSTAGAPVKLAVAIQQYAVLRGLVGGRDGPDVLDLVQHFFRDYPGFDAPLLAMSLYQTLATTATALGMDILAAQCVEKLPALRQQCPWRFGVDALDDPALDDSQAFRLWEPPNDVFSAHTVFEFSGRTLATFSLVCATLLHRWVQRDVQNGDLSLAEAKCILRLDAVAEAGRRQQRHQGGDGEAEKEATSSSAPATAAQQRAGQQTTTGTLLLCLFPVAKLRALAKRGTSLLTNSEKTAFLARLQTAPCTPAELVRRVAGDPKPRDGADWAAWLGRVEVWLDQDGRGKPSRYQRLLILKNLQYCRVMGLSAYVHAHPGDSDWLKPLLWTESQRQRRLFERLQALDQRLVTTENMDYARFQEAASCQVAATVAKDAASAASSGGVVVTDQVMQETADALDALRNDLLARDRLEMAYRAQTVLADLLVVRHVVFGAGDPWDALPAFAAVEDLGAALRLELSALAPLASFQAKEYHALHFFEASFRQRVLFVCVASVQAYLASAPDKRAQYDRERRWPQLVADTTCWVQRFKARALREVLGVHLRPPARLLRLVEADPDAGALWAQLTALHGTMRTSASLQERVATRAQTAAVVQTLRDRHPVFRAFLDLQQGRGISADEFVRLGQELGPSVVVVEWVELRDAMQEWDLLVLVYRAGTLVMMTPVLGTKIADLEGWVDTFLSVETNDAIERVRPLSHRLARHDVNLLRPLVAPLQTCTAAGDTLLFCPTGQMHRLPLHAISLGGTVLIERNPVVYVQSLTLLRMCIDALAGAPRDGAPPSSPSPPRALFAATIFNTLEDSRRTAGTAAALARLADETVPNAVLIDSSNFTNDRKAVFRDRCLRSHLVHVHGHAEFADEGDDHGGGGGGAAHGRPTQCLKLREPGSADEETTGSDDLDLEAIFTDVRFRQPSIMLAMGCRTGRSRISAVDDLLGLIAGFHVAGAGAVIGSLWNIDEPDALQFAQVFYETFVQGMAGDGEGDGDVDGASDGVDTKPGFVDLAKACQKAVLTVRKDDQGKVRKPYHWAGFVLHGAWMFPKLPLVDASDCA